MKKKISIIIIFFAIILILLFVFQDSIIIKISLYKTQQLYRENFEKAKKLHMDGKYEEAFSLLQNYRDSNDEIGNLYYEIKFDFYSSKIDEIKYIEELSEVSDFLIEMEKEFQNKSEYKFKLEKNFTSVAEEMIKKSDSLEDFEKWEEISAVLIENDNIELSEMIIEVLNSLATVKLKLALNGVWQRENDYLSGSTIEISFNGEIGSAIITKAVNNEYGFTEGDVKWKNIKILNATTFTFEDLNKGYVYVDGGYNATSSYTEAQGELDYETLKIKTQANTDVSNLGAVQSWKKTEKKTNKKVTSTEQQSTFSLEQNTPETINNSKTSSTPTFHSNDYILPSSDSMYYTKKDLESLTSEELRIARNEIYARHGRKFQDEALQTYFDSCSWYYGYIEPEDFRENILNDYEIANRDLIKECEE